MPLSGAHWVEVTGETGRLHSLERLLCQPDLSMVQEMKTTVEMKRGAPGIVASSWYM